MHTIQNFHDLILNNKKYLNPYFTKELKDWEQRVDKIKGIL